MAGISNELVGSVLEVEDDVPIGAIVFESSVLVFSSVAELDSIASLFLLFSCGVDASAVVIIEDASADVENSKLVSIEVGDSAVIPSSVLFSVEDDWLVEPISFMEPEFSPFLVLTLVFRLISFDASAVIRQVMDCCCCSHSPGDPL